MKVFTIAEGVSPGATVSFLNFESAGIVNMPCVIVGEVGRNRFEGKVAVEPEAVELDIDTGESNISDVRVALSKDGVPKLYKADIDDHERCLIIVRTPIGFRGYAQHTGDRTGIFCTNELCRYKADIAPMAEVPQVCPSCGEENTVLIKMARWPGENIATGKIGEGPQGLTAGAMQFVTIMPKGEVFRISLGSDGTKKSGSTYYCFDGENLNSLTWSERRLTELF